ncbi:hypothetical protein JW933_08675 [candidate division FCPU426 bacterium]|nr:hypothetical protein [candidate division FCPU426 bacterium]
MRRWFIPGVALTLFLPMVSHAKIDLSGAVRNDAVFYGADEQTLFLNILENKLILQRSTKDWKFYSDLRFYLYYGEGVETPAGWPEELEYITASLPRAFVRYYSNIGDFTLGKTYVNFGIMGPFNIFELDPNVNFSDLNYTKEGVVAITYEAPLGDVSGVKAYVSPESRDTDMSAGASVYTNWGAFDVGLVTGRTGRDLNFAGVYFKGDAEVELQGACAIWADDAFAECHVKAIAGADYGLFDTQLLFSVQYLYNDCPVRPAAGGTSTTVLSTAVSTGFSDRHYLYASAAYTPDEFFRAGVDAFVNAADNSCLIVPAATWVLADGLNLTLLAAWPTGTGDTQFSKAAIGNYAALVRVEAAL